MDLLSDLPVPHEDGSFINAKVSRIAELIREYDRNIDIRWIPRDKREPGDAAFALVDTTPGQREYVMFYVQEEADFDERVLARIYENDAARHGNVLSRIDAQNAAVRAEQQRKHKEQLEESRDLAYHILRSPKATYRHNGRKYE